MRGPSKGSVYCPLGWRARRPRRYDVMHPDHTVAGAMHDVRLWWHAPESRVYAHPTQIVCQSSRYVDSGTLSGMPDVASLPLYDRLELRRILSQEARGSSAIGEISVLTSMDRARMRSVICTPDQMCVGIMCLNSSQAIHCGNCQIHHSNLYSGPLDMLFIADTQTLPEHHSNATAWIEPLRVCLQHPAFNMQMQRRVMPTLASTASSSCPCYEQLPNRRHQNLKAFEEHIQQYGSVCFVTEQYLYNLSGYGVRVVWKLFMLNLFAVKWAQRRREGMT